MLETVVKRETIDGVRVVSVANEVDIASAGILQRHLDEAADGGAATLVVSLADCSYMDSTGLRPIMRLSERIGDGLFVVVPPKTRIRRIFDLTQLHEHVHVCDTLETALAQASAHEKAMPA